MRSLGGTKSIGRHRICLTWGAAAAAASLSLRPLFRPPLGTLLMTSAALASAERVVGPDVACSNTPTW